MGNVFQLFPLLRGKAESRTEVPLIPETRKEVNGGLINPLLHTPSRILNTDIEGNITPTLQIDESFQSSAYTVDATSLVLDGASHQGLQQIFVMPGALQQALNSLGSLRESLVRPTSRWQVTAGNVFQPSSKSPLTCSGLALRGPAHVSEEEGERVHLTGHSDLGELAKSRTTVPLISNTLKEVNGGSSIPCCTLPAES